MRRSRLLVAAALGAVVLGQPHAHAATANEGVWDDGDTYATCGTGTNSRRCTYDHWSWGCTEYAAFGSQLAGCGARVRLEVTITPILQGASQVVGCRGDAIVPGRPNYVAYDSSISAFDNPAIDQYVRVTVYDLFSDNKPGVVSYLAFDVTEHEAGLMWVAEGAFESSCTPGSHPTSGGYGTVTTRL